MKRKIAAILAADISGYTKLVADDEEETIRRLGAYRAVFDDLIQRYGGRIFNTAGDAVMAEFPSSVEAVRCAVDVQESLRTRNLAYPSSRQMHFRIGITVGDVIEREGDLLGDGVNIAARLEGLAPPGGVCISNSVFDQVANKVSVEFADIGAQSVKNLPRPVHAYVLSQDKQGIGVKRIEPVSIGGESAQRRRWLLAAAGGIASLALLAAGLKIFLPDRPAAGTAPVAATIATVAPARSAQPAPPLVQPAPAPPSSVQAAPTAPAAASIQGEYTGTLQCEKLPWTKAPLTAAVVLSIKPSTIAFSRDVWSNDGTRKIGVETGSGTLAPDGVLLLTTNWVGPTARFDGSYAGKLTAGGGSVNGRQVLLVNGERHYRTCAMTFQKSPPI